MNDSSALPAKRRWYRLTPDRFLIGLLGVEGILWLSERFGWVPFNEKKGYTVLIAVAAVGVTIMLMLLWFAASLLLRWRFQFSLRSLLALVVTVAIACSWLTVKLREAKQQREVREAIWAALGDSYYDFEFDGYQFVNTAEAPAPAWLRDLLGGVDFFADVVFVTDVWHPSPSRVSSRPRPETDASTARPLASARYFDEDLLERLKSLPELEVLWIWALWNRTTNAQLAKEWRLHTIQGS